MLWGQWLYDRKKYTELAKEKHDLGFDVMRKLIDHDFVYKAGCGKKHDRHFLVDVYIDSRVSASQSQSISTGTDDNKDPSGSKCRPWDEGGRDTLDAPSKSAGNHDLVT
jgi:hypothetical protein